MAIKEYGFGLNWGGQTKEYFVKSLESFCLKKRLSFLWISQDNEKEVLKQLQKRELKIKFLLDTQATYNDEKDIYARICYTVKDSGSIVINDPDRTKSYIDKSVMHYELLKAGITVPYSLIIRSWEPSNFKLPDEEKNNLGTPFIVKPACGYAQQGVLTDANGSASEIARARKFDPNDNFLLQEKISPVDLDGKRAWFRIFYLFGKIIPCWWDDRHCLYQHATVEDFRKHSLWNLAKTTLEIARINQMQWFSTEIAIDRKGKTKRFVVIDYVNDQCDMTSQCESEKGIPNAIVDYTAYSIVSTAHRLINKRAANKDSFVWFKDKSVVSLMDLEEADLSSHPQTTATKSR